VAQARLLAALAQQNTVSPIQRLKPPTHRSTELFRRTRSRQLDDALHHAEEILAAMFDFSCKKSLPFLKTLALGDVERHADETNDIPVLIGKRCLGREPVARAPIICPQLLLDLVSGLTSHYPLVIIHHGTGEFLVG